MLAFAGVNWLAVLVAALVGFAIGAAWYSPLLFGKPWAALMGFDDLTPEKVDEMKQDAMTGYAVSVLGLIVTGTILALLLAGLGISGSAMLSTALAWSAAVWVGFTAPPTLTNTIFGDRPMKLWAIDGGYQLVYFLVMGAILALWP